MTTANNDAADAYLVLGNPIAHSRSPAIHARFAELTGQAMRYERLLVPLDGFAAALQAIQAQGVRGCNVTVPFKFEAFETAHTHSERAQLARAANTLRFEADGRIYADNTDGAGLVHDIEHNAGVPLAGRDILLIGAGGAAAGVLAPLMGARPRRLVVANRSVEKAHALVQRHLVHASLQEVLATTELTAQGLDSTPGTFDIVINASASSLSGAAVPVSGEVLRPGAWVYDMMYGPLAETFLAWAREHGAQGRDGLGMLVEQAAEAFFVWRGVRPPSAQVLAELRAALPPAP
jgi:shikimate dehydrogenase